MITSLRSTRVALLKLPISSRCTANATAGLVLGSSAIVYGSIFTGVLGGISALLTVAQKNVSRVEKFSEQRNKPVSYVRSKPEQYIQPLMLGASVALGTDTIGHAIIGDQPLHEIVKNAQLAIGLSAYVSGIYATSAHGKQKQDVQTQDQEVRR